jgi:peptidoglycan/xylan/chitin deacetylase (PgdA/CDA1 family)
MMLPFSLTTLAALLLNAQAPAPAAPGAPLRQMAITIDDLPGVGVSDLPGLVNMNRRMLAALRAAGAPAIGFVNESALHVAGERDRRVGILQAWLDAGMTLGNHTFRHKGLTATPLPEYQDDVLRGEAITRLLLERRQLPLVYFRHPYTQTGPTAEVKAAFESFLAQHGYRVAPFTIEHSDWVFAALYGDALARGDRPDQRALKTAYLQHLEQVCTFFEGLARQMFGRDIPQILLTHVNRLNADSMPELLALLRRRGYQFVTLDQALADQAYRSPDHFVGDRGPSWLHRWTVARKEPMRLRDEPDMPADLYRRAEALRAKRRSAAPAQAPATAPASAPAP